MKKKLTKIQVQQLNSTAEIDNNTKINDFMGLQTAMNFDIYKEGSYIIEAKLDIRDSSNGLKKASQELNKYKEKLMFLGMKLPKLRLILDYETKKLYLPNGDVYCKLEEFDFNLPEDYENYDITYDNGDNVAQQIYSRHEKINDSNIFDYFQTGIDWYNPTKLNQQDFRLKLDLFNDPETQRKRGAFYTPDNYISISTEFVRQAIKKVPKGMDYVILDRCAGSGQLEKLLTDEELSHCILNTLGIAEWISLWNIYGTKARLIIPPYVKGKVINEHTSPDELNKQCDFIGNSTRGADALAEQFYKDNAKHWEGKFVILLENPPYADMNTNMHKKSTKGQTNQSWIKNKMIENKLGNAGNDLYSQFVWSAWNIVKCNEYIVYGPIKQWKLNNLINKHFNAGHLCNRELFHASKSAISLAWYSNKDAIEDKLNYKSDLGDRIVSRITNKWNLFVEHNKNLPVIAKIVVQGGNRNMQGASIYDPDAHQTSHVKYLDRENLIKNLPLFVANFWKDKDYTSIDVIMKSADGGHKYLKDAEFLNACAVWTYYCFENQSSNKSPIWRELEKQCDLPSDLKNQAKNILRYAGIAEWVGLKYIDKTYNLKEENRLGKKVPINVQLDTSIKEMKDMLKQYYEDNISDKMFKYELLK